MDMGKGSWHSGVGQILPEIQPLLGCVALGELPDVFKRQWPLLYLSLGLQTVMLSKWGDG